MQHTFFTVAVGACLRGGGAYSQFVVLGWGLIWGGGFLRGANSRIYGISGMSFTWIPPWGPGDQGIYHTIHFLMNVLIHFVDAFDERINVEPSTYSQLNLSSLYLSPGADLAKILTGFGLLYPITALCAIGP